MIRKLWVVTLLSIACGKADATKEPAKADPSSAPVASAAPAVSSSPVAAASSSAPVVVAVTSAGATAPVGTPGKVATAPGTGTGTGTGPGIVVAPLAPGAGMHFDGAHFAVDVPTPAACDKGSECKIPVRLSAKDEFHVNKEYPYKLKMDDSPFAEFLGSDAQNKGTFSKAAGDFAFDGEKAGVMTVRLKPTSSGALLVSGTLKLSVCNASNCMLETAQVRATVPVR